MSIITPRSSETLAASSMAFVKPLPQRDHESRRAQGDSAEFDIVGTPPPQGSTLDLWRKLQPDLDAPGDAASGCSGVMLGHFRIEEQIGRGGMGAVFRAIDTRLDREVALKVLAGPQSTDQSAVERFLNEARAAARLDHDNVARVFYVGEDQGLHFIAFEFIHGANVRQVIDARGMLSPLEAVNYGLQIANALRHIADAGVVHRDVKPSNIIITPTGRAKLVDLGLARKHDPDASRDLTVDGTTLGTFDYISPEQAKDPRKVDIRSDIYSLGCTLYHMLTGQPPYPQGTMLQKLLDHQGKDVPVATERNGNVPPELSAVVKKMMASLPSERYATADELIGDLSILAHAYGLRPIAPGSFVWAVPGRPNGWTLLRRYRAWLATAGLLIFAVFLIDGMQSDTSPSEPLSLAIDRRSPAGETTGESSTAPTLSPAGQAHRDPSSSNGNLSVSQSATPAQVSDASEGPVDARIPAQPSPESAEMSFDEFRESFLENFYQPILGSNQASPVAPQLPTQSPGMANGASASPEADGETAESPDGLIVPTEDTVAAVNFPTEPFVVRIDGEDPRGYASLEAACRDAPDGSSIELNFDGLLSDRQRPVRFTGKKLRIYPVTGRRPVIRFAVPPELTSAQIVRMITVNRGSLEVYNVDFIVEVDPKFPTDQWVLLSLSQADAVMLRGVSVTVDNALQLSAAMIEIAESPLLFADRMPEAQDRPVLRFDAEDCFFRGQADLFVNESVDPARISLSNVAVALHGSLIRFLGMEAIDVLTDMNNDHLVELELRHLTAALAAEMVRFEIDPGKSAPRLAVSADNSVIVLEENHPLVTMTADIDASDAQQLLVEWSGDRTFVQALDPVWSISGLYDDREIGLSEWNDHWKKGHLVRPDGAQLLRSSRSVMYSEMTAVDLALSFYGTAENPARSGASDGTDAGVQWESLRLPKLSVPIDNDGPAPPGE